MRRVRGTPHDMREGMLGAMALVREGLDETARSLAAAAGERGLGGGGGTLAGAVGGMLAGAEVGDGNGAGGASTDGWPEVTLAAKAVATIRNIARCSGLMAP